MPSQSAILSKWGGIAVIIQISDTHIHIIISYTYAQIYLYMYMQRCIEWLIILSSTSVVLSLEICKYLFNYPCMRVRIMCVVVCIEIVWKVNCHKTVRLNANHNCILLIIWHFKYTDALAFTYIHTYICNFLHKRH